MANILLQLIGAIKFKTRAHILIATIFIKVNKTSAQLRGKGKRFPPTLVVNICVVAAAPRKQFVIIFDKNNLKDAIWGIQRVICLNCNTFLGKRYPTVQNHGDCKAEVRNDARRAVSIRGGRI